MGACTASKSDMFSAVVLEALFCGLSSSVEDMELCDGRHKSYAYDYDVSNDDIKWKDDFGLWKDIASSFRKS